MGNWTNKKRTYKKNIYIDSATLDSILWNYGEINNKTNSHHHRTLTIFY